MDLGGEPLPSDKARLAERLAPLPPLGELPCLTAAPSRIFPSTADFSPLSWAPRSRLDSQSMRTLSLMALGLSVGLLGGCSCDERPPPSRQVPQRGGAAEAAELPTERGRPRTPPSIRARAPSTRGASATSADAGVERDLNAELSRGFGDPTACLSWSADAPDTISIEIAVTIARLGTVTRSTARGAGLDHDARRCLEARANRVSFASPVPAAPASARASFTIENRRPATAAPVPTPQEQTSGNVLVLEAVPGVAIAGPAGDPISGPAGDEISGPSGDRIDGPAGVPIEANPGIAIGEE